MRGQGQAAVDEQRLAGDIRGDERHLVLQPLHDVLLVTVMPVPSRRERRRYEVGSTTVRSVKISYSERARGSPARAALAYQSGRARISHRGETGVRGEAHRRALG